MNTIFINDKLVTQEEALISVDERGFRFGDGVFETIPIHNAAPYLWHHHIERLGAGLAALQIHYPLDALQTRTQQLLQKNEVTEGLVRIYISRGTGSRGYMPKPTSPPLLVIQTLMRPNPLSDAFTLWLSTIEKISPRALPTEYKVAQGMNATLARLQAREHDCNDALQRDAAGHIAEAASANIFWLKAGTLYTPSLASGALAGVTRRRLLEISPYPTEEGLYTIDTLAKAEAVILTNASMGITAVKALKPASITWQSEALAHELLTLRNQDIAVHTR